VLQSRQLTRFESGAVQLITKQLDLLNDALALAPENYKDNVRIISSLDDKAQKMGTIAGVFLGVLLALVKPDQLANLLGLIGQTGIAVFTSVTILLMLCIGLCLWCMWTEKIPPPLSLGHLTYIIENAFKEKDLDDEAQEDYCKEKIAIWQSCIDAQGRVAKSKQRRVLGAQVVLAIAMILVACMLLYLIHSVHPIELTAPVD
jgi:hypothetical protein